MKFFGTAVVTAACLACSTLSAADVPRGIYSLGRAQDIASTPQDDRLDGIRDYDFVSGFTLRVFWKDVELAQGVYDFGVIDQAVQQVAALGQGLNLEILNGEEPAYVLDGAAATYVDHRGGTNPVPWDAFARSRMAALYSALGSHIVSGPTGSHPLREDPTLLAIDAAPAGLNFGVRDINSGIRNHPDYTQQRYIDAVVEGVAASAAAFPHDTNFLAFFGFTDGQAGTPVDEQIIDRLAPLYNGPEQVKLDFFIENLSDDGPAPSPNGMGTGNNLLNWIDHGGDTMMQALDSWLAHRPDREPQLDSHTPATGIALAYEYYRTRFFELYVADLDGAANGEIDAFGRPLIDDLRAWNRTLTAPVTIPGDYNADGIVDAADYTTWRDNLESPVSLPNDVSSGVAADDYQWWKTHYGESASNSVQFAVMAEAVPEGSAAAAAALIFLMVVSRPRRVAERQCAAEY